VTVRTDPEGNETDALFDLVELEGAHALEFGAGELDPRGLQGRADGAYLPVRDPH